MSEINGNLILHTSAQQSLKRVKFSTFIIECGQEPFVFVRIPTKYTYDERVF